VARVFGFGRRQRVLSRPEGSDNANQQGEPHIVAPNGDPVYEYESPRLMVVGGVRKFSTGSSSSGKADANSQYYW
jgi:hypothetical protein